MKSKAIVMNPTEVRFPERDTQIVEIKLGECVTIALSNYRGEVWTWGANDVGQLGLGDTVPRIEPEKVTLLPKQGIKVECGLKHCVVLCKNLTMYAWGDNSQGQLGSKTEDGTQFSSIPVAVEAYSEAQAWSLTSGYYHTIVSRPVLPARAPQICRWSRSCSARRAPCPRRRSVID